MTITSQLFEAYIKCPTKCFLKGRGEVGTGNAYAGWVREQNVLYRSEGTKRMTRGNVCECINGTSEAVKLKSPHWHLAVVLLAAVLNSPTYGAGVRLAPGAILDDGLLHVVVIEDIGAFEILKLLPSLISSGELRTSRLKRWQVSKVRLTTRNPTAFHGDGEILGSTPVEIEVLPRAIRVLAPCED
jgi:diacylglycerol kinase family enzyme